MEWLIFWGFLSLWLVTYGIGTLKPKQKDKRNLLLPATLIAMGLINIFFVALKLYELGFLNKVCLK